MIEPRSGVPRPPGGAYAFVCRRCQVIYRDGVDYSTCMVCNGHVDWFEPSTPEASTRAVASVTTMARYALIAFVLVQTVFALVDPHAFPYLAPILLVAQLGALAVVLFVAFASREIRTLIDHRTRIVHGLEHATIKILLDRGVPVNGGITHHRQFVLSIANNGTTWDQFPEIESAAREAIQRVMAGEHELAYTPRCGTSFLVARCLFCVAVVVAGLGAWAFGAPLGIMWAATVGAALSAGAVARPAGLAVQRWLTVSTDLASGAVTNVERTVTSSGDWLHVTVSLDVEPRATLGGLVSPTPLG